MFIGRKERDVPRPKRDTEAEMLAATKELELWFKDMEEKGLAYMADGIRDVIAANPDLLDELARILGENAEALEVLDELSA
jgi:hypothetical protein